MTAEGAALYEVTRSGFAAIAAVVARLREETNTARITLSSTTALLGHWLTSRLEALPRELPSVDLRLHASDAVVDLEAGGIEAAIRYGKGPFAKAREIDTRSGQHFPDSLLAVQAAIVSRVLASDALRAGLLVAPFAVSLPGERYHFVRADGLQHRPDIASLRNWFARELRLAL